MDIIAKIEDLKCLEANLNQQLIFIRERLDKLDAIQAMDNQHVVKRISALESSQPKEENEPPKLKRGDSIRLKADEDGCLDIGVVISNDPDPYIWVDTIGNTCFGDRNRLREVYREGKSIWRKHS